MPATRRTGTIVRPLPDYFPSDLSGAHGVVSACPGHFQAFGIFNNSSGGSILKVYAYSGFTPTGTGFLLHSQVYGQPFSTVGTTYGSIDPSNPGTWGLPVQGGNAALLGKQVGGTVLQQNVNQFISTGYPLAIIIPGWTWLLQQNNSGFELDASIWWLSCKS